MSPQVPHGGHGRTHIGTVYLGGIFSDGGGIEISPTKDGGLVIKHIPPRSPAFGNLSARELELSAGLKAQLGAYVQGGEAAGE